jgi:hypothetical protein
MSNLIRLPIPQGHVDASKYPQSVISSTLMRSKSKSRLVVVCGVSSATLTIQLLVNVLRQETLLEAPVCEMLFHAAEI